MTLDITLVVGLLNLQLKPGANPWYFLPTLKSVILQVLSRVSQELKNLYLR